jgi:hypothetical protein
MKRFFYIAAVSGLALVTMGASGPMMNDVPAYNAAPPKKGQKLTPILKGMQLTGPYFQHPVQVKSYQIAAKTARVLHQLPCYCYCDRGHGHASLRTCFESEHGAHCSTCMQEVFYADRELKKGKTVKQIRAGIIKGEFKKIDLQSIR